MNSELEDSDIEINLKAKQQKFNPNIIRDKIIQMFRKKANQNRNSTQTITNQTSLSCRHDIDRSFEIEEDSISDLSDSTIPVDQWSIESVPKPGFTPVEYLQVFKFVSEKEKR